MPVKICIIVIFLLIIFRIATAQPEVKSSGEMIRLTESIGDTIDPTERERYHLFGSYQGFKYAEFRQSFNASPVAFITVVVDSTERVVTKSYTWETFQLMREQVAYLSQVQAAASERKVKIKEEQRADSTHLASTKLTWINAAIGGAKSTVWGGGSVLLSLNKTRYNSNRIWIYRTSLIFEGGLDIDLKGFKLDFSSDRRNSIGQVTDNAQPGAGLGSKFCSTSYPKEGEAITDYGVLTGFISKGDYSFTSLAAGLALVIGNRRSRNEAGSYNLEPFFTIGIPFEASATLIFLPFHAEGLQISGNLNPVRSFITIHITTQWGKMRPWKSDRTVVQPVP